MKSIHILLVEDNEGDILLTTEAFQDSKIVNRISVLRDGHEAISYFAETPSDMPDLVLLDINLPKRSGHEVLHYIKSSPACRHLPVIMLTTSSSGKDVLQSYEGHANCFITKPVEVTDFMEAIGKIEDFWINIVTIP